MTAVWAAKLAALGIIYQMPAARPAGWFRQYRRREAAALEDWTTWCALAEDTARISASGRSGWAHPHIGGRPGERDRLRPRVEFHAWLQWLLEGQLASAQRAALAAGMPIGVISDLAVGAYPGGADSWAQPGRSWRPG